MFEVALPSARAVFTTRSGGQSEGPYASRNLGIFTDDDTAVVRRNIGTLQNELELPAVQLLQQVHGAVIKTVSPHTDRAVPIADAAVTGERGVGMLVTGADCPAVVLASHERLAILHCGWRPVAAGLIEKAVQEFSGEEIHAAIGPGICQDHFEVGPEVVQSMGAHGEEFSEGRQLDLIGLVDRRLREAGAARVHIVQRCTHCEPEFFFSHRRDGAVTGRHAGVAWRI